MPEGSCKEMEYLAEKHEDANPEINFQVKEETFLVPFTIAKNEKRLQKHYLISALLSDTVKSKICCCVTSV